MIHHCAFEGCLKSTERPFSEGWASLATWGPGVRDGRYCAPHASVLEALLLSGELGQAQRTPNRRARKALR
jgi:hypothetical protein